VHSRSLASRRARRKLMNTAMPQSRASGIVTSCVVHGMVIAAALCSRQVFVRASGSCDRSTRGSVSMSRRFRRPPRGDSLLAPGSENLSQC
jgi:hypothetical protein